MFAMKLFLFSCQALEFVSDAKEMVHPFFIFLVYQLGKEGAFSLILLKNRNKKRERDVRVMVGLWRT